MTDSARSHWLQRIAMLSAITVLLTLSFWPRARPVDSASVERGTVRETVEAEGRSRLRDRYLISSPVQGRSRRLELEPGTPLGAGEPLLTIDPAASSALDPRSRQQAEQTLAAARARAAAAVAIREAAHTAAQQSAKEAERLQRLQAHGLVATQTAEQALSLQQRLQREAASARFQAAAAQHEVDLAAAALANLDSDAGGEPLVLRAPVEGLLLRRHVESAQPVSIGTALLELGDPASLEVEVDVLSADAVRLREGMPVELLRWGSDAALHGHVRLIEPAGFTKISALGVEEQRVWVHVTLDSPREDWQRLGDAYRLTARFLLAQAESVLRLPSSALYRRDEQWSVFRITDSRARETAVEVGLRGEGWAEVRAGLSEGDAVVLHPDRELNDGDRVAARE